LAFGLRGSNLAGHRETDFETAIEAGLIGVGGYAKRAPAAYDEALALFLKDVTGFLKDGQAAKWVQLEALLGAKTEATILDSLAKELDIKGTLHVLRHGFKCYGKTFQLAYFRPNSGMNAEAAEAYAKNRLTLTRQIAFTSAMKKADGTNRRCIIDVTLAVNGLPVVTAELKNPLTGQRGADAVQQYREDRDERDLLFAFKKRALVHFAVDPDEAWMTTRSRARRRFFCHSTAAAITARATRLSKAIGRRITCGMRFLRPTASSIFCNDSCTLR
jgi:type I restriction enzyme, R subunit